ncbi:hypothetical protein B566_EDAN019047 [Ephemera danica]|nr:hypothetical protein B566_EDAN019047 [Ephemera danica]
MSPAVLRSGALLMLALHTHIHAYVMFTEPIVKLPPGNYCKTSDACYYEGQYYQRGECVYTNCNICSCKESLTRDNELEMICEQTPCIVDVTLKESVNLNLDLIWHASNYSFYWARSLQDGVQYRLGTLEPGRMICGIKSSETDLDKMYPSCFDARIQWPDWVSGVQDQGWCSSSWALSTVQTASDRMAIWSKGAKLFEFSAQQLLDCNLDEQSRACRGGHLDRAWLYIDDSGLLEERCYSYTSGNTSDVDECLMSDKMSDDCQPITLPKTEDHHSGRIYLLPTEQAIMHEIMTYGPVQATMSVHRDFFMYQSGVYQPSPEVLDRVEGYHSVRLLGWGVDIDNDRHAVKYWLAANTWCTHWGEKGYFRIRRGHNDCEIESYVIATKPFHNASSNDLEEDDSDEYDNY